MLTAGGMKVTTRCSTNETVGLTKEEGTCLGMRFDANWIHLFDQRDGRTIA